jgi:hypothetical protein
MAYLPPTLGKDCKLYRNTGTDASPTWVLIDNVRDLKLVVDADDIDTTTRASGGFKEHEVGLFDASVEFDMIWDLLEPSLIALYAAFQARSYIQFAVLDGAVTAGLHQGLRAVCKIFGMPRDEPLSGAVKTTIKLKPCRNAFGAAGVNAPPVWFTGTA